MEAQEYDKLVEALRCKSLSKECDSCDYGYRLCPDSECNDACHVEQIYADAAAAIEALQAEQKKTVTHIFCEEQVAWEGRCKDLIESVHIRDKHLDELNHYIWELEAQLPKRGEWIEDTTTYAGPGLSNYKCSLCGKICGTWRSGLKPSELPNWCGNCGADMRKMEAQE